MSDDDRAPAAPEAGRYIRVGIGETTTVRRGDILVDPIDFDEQVRGIPDGVSVKGIFPNVHADYVRVTRPEAYAAYKELHPRRFPVYSRVPAPELLRGIYDAGRLSHPDVRVAEGMRRVGWAAYQSFLGSLFGRMLFAALGKDIDAIYQFGPRAFAYGGNVVRVTYTRLGDQHFRYDYDPCFAWLGNYQVGVAEGVAAACGRSTEIRVHLAGHYHGWIECRWF